MNRSGRNWASPGPPMDISCVPSQTRAVSGWGISDLQKFLAGHSPHAKSPPSGLCTSNQRYRFGGRMSDFIDTAVVCPTFVSSMDGLVMYNFGPSFLDGLAVGGRFWRSAIMRRYFSSALSLSLCSAARALRSATKALCSATKALRFSRQAPNDATTRATAAMDQNTHLPHDLRTCHPAQEPRMARTPPVRANSQWS